MSFAWVFVNFGQNLQKKIKHVKKFKKNLILILLKFLSASAYRNWFTVEKKTHIHAKNTIGNDVLHQSLY